MNNDTKILVTGIAGFMGSWIADTLLQRGYDVYGIDDLSGGYMENVPDDVIREGNVFRFDLRNEKLVDEGFRNYKWDYVFHVAAHPHEGLSQFCPNDIFTTTCNASLNVFKACVNYNVKKVIYFSSMARYGHGNFSPPFSETLPRNPADVYGAAKSAAEVLLEAFSKAHGLRYTILVPHNVYGPRQNLADPYRNVIAIWVNCILRGKLFYIYGDGEQKRSFSYIADSLPCYIKAIDKFVDGEIINIGSEKEYTLNELAKIIEDVSKENGYKVKHKHLEDRPCEVKNAYCTIEKSEMLLDFEDKTSLEDGIRKTFEWARIEGPKEPQYLEELEIEKNVPKVWSEKLV